MNNEKKIFARLIFIAMISLCSFAASAQILPPKGEIPEGYEVIDGDILMPKGFLQSLQLGITPDATFRTNLWTNGIVRFEFDANVTAANQTNMISAMAVLENVANVDFQQCAANNCGGVGNYAHIQNSTANNSQVGMVGGLQAINIISWNSQFIIVHELLHCLGFYHEQVRPDRSTYVQINCNASPQPCNIQGGFGGSIYNNNFSVPGDPSIFGTYDFDSVMHYDQCAFSIDCPAGATCNCTNTVITVLAPNQSWQTLIGQRTHLSELDKATVSYLYPPANWTFYDCTYNNIQQNGTFLRPFSMGTTAINNTPLGGTLVVLKDCSFPNGTYNRNITIKAAPNVTARFGS
jgi:hypothetical protein